MLSWWKLIVVVGQMSYPIIDSDIECRCSVDPDVYLGHYCELDKYPTEYLLRVYDVGCLDGLVGEIPRDLCLSKKEVGVMLNCNLDIHRP